MKAGLFFIKKQRIRVEQAKSIYHAKEFSIKKWQITERSLSVLVLKRALQEKVYIGIDREITITICAMNSSHVSLGIEAPESYPIRRDDIKKKPNAKAFEHAQKRSLLLSSKRKAQNAEGCFHA